MKFLYSDDDHTYYGMKKGENLLVPVKIIRYDLDSIGNKIGDPTIITEVESWEAAELYFINGVNDLFGVYKGS